MISKTTSSPDLRLSATLSNCALVAAALLVDPRNHQPGFQTLLIGKAARPQRLNHHSARPKLGSQSPE